MAWSVPRTLRTLRPALAHFQHALPLRLPVPSGRHDPRPLVRARSVGDAAARPPRLQDRRAALGQARRARPRRVGADEGRHRRAVRHRAGEDHRHAARRRSRVLAGDGKPGEYVLLVGSVEKRKNPLAAAAAASEVGLPLVAVGPVRDNELARELERRGRELRGYVTQERARRALPRRRLPRHAVPLRGLRPARARGDGLRDAGRRRAGCCAARGRR